MAGVKLAGKFLVEKQPQAIWRYEAGVQKGKEMTRLALKCCYSDCVGTDVLLTI